MNCGLAGELAELQSRESRLQAELQRRQMERRMRQEQRCERRMELLAEVEQQEVGNGGMPWGEQREDTRYLGNHLTIARLFMSYSWDSFWSNLVVTVYEFGLELQVWALETACFEAFGDSSEIQGFQAISELGVWQDLLRVAEEQANSEVAVARELEQDAAVALLLVVIQR